MSAGDVTTQRLDAFADAAFAFAVSLMVVGAGAPAVDAKMLAASISAIPSFGIGFAIIVMFWHTHARWRALRGPGGMRATLLTLALIFVVLVYVTPLRAMAQSFAAFLGGRGGGFEGGLGRLFAIYGSGFVAMAALTALLFVDVAASADRVAAVRAQARGEAIIWGIAAVTGAISTLMSLQRATEFHAPWVYASLPLTIGLFAWRYRWN